jgi:hypothetical protein
MNCLIKLVANAICPLLLCFIPFLGSGQDIGTGNGLKEMKGHLLNGVELQMDGIIDEAFWLNIPANGNFLMQEPIEGNEPTDRTEIRVAFDKQNIYIGVICHDSDPSGIKAFQKKRDAPLETDDGFRWIFDTFMDKRRAYFFEINPLGLRGDGGIVRMDHFPRIRAQRADRPSLFRRHRTLRD